MTGFTLSIEACVDHVTSQVTRTHNVSPIASLSARIRQLRI